MQTRSFKWASVVNEVIPSYGGKVPGGATLKVLADFAYTST